MSPDTTTTTATPLATQYETPPTPHRRWWVWLLVLVVLLFGALGAWYWWPKSADPATTTTGKGRGDPSAKPLPVVAAPAKTGSIDVYLNALGTVTPRNIVTVHTRVDGELMSVAFKEGQIVKAGDLLAAIDPRPFQVMLTQAQGQMAKDQALLKNAQLDLERYRTLLAQDSIASQQVDTQEALVRQYEGTVLADQGAIDNAKLQLTYARVTAPIGGRVGLRQVDPGNVVHAADTTGLVVITQLQPSTVIFPIPEDNVPQVMKRMQSGEAIVVDAWDRDQKVKLATGKLLTVDNQIDPTTGTVKLKAEFPNDNLALFPNQFVNIRMLVQTLPDATLIPSAAIQRGAPGTFVYVVKAGQERCRDTGQARAGAGRDHRDRERIGARRRGRRRRRRQAARGRESRIDHARRADQLRQKAPVARVPDAATGRRAAERALAKAAALPEAPLPPLLPPAGRRPLKTADDRAAAARVVSAHHESVSHLHPAPGRHHAADGGDPAGGHRRLSRAAAVRAARSRLSDDSGRDAVSRGESRCDDVVGHCAARAAIRTDAGTQPDVVDELRRRIGDHIAVQPRAVAGCGRAGGAGGDQRGRQFPSNRPA